jgi:hypothetical protein
LQKLIGVCFALQAKHNQVFLVQHFNGLTGFFGQPYLPRFLLQNLATVQPFAQALHSFEFDLQHTGLEGVDFLGQPYLPGYFLQKAITDNLALQD